MELLDPKNIYCLIDELSIPEIYKLRSLQKFMSRYEVVPKTIFDLGARDLYESIWFAVNYPEASIHSFECNPDMIELCEKRSKYFPNIKLNNAAVSISEAPMTFYKIDQEKTKSQQNIPYYIKKDGNPGASSLFKTLDSIYSQIPVEVQAIRLDNYLKQNNIDTIDLLWMDIQGSELNALKSLEENIRKVKMIHTEMPVGSNTEYDGAPTAKEIHSYLLEHKFELVGTGEMDYIYINKNK
jgi:FkbM family methyltransferase